MRYNPGFLRKVRELGFINKDRLEWVAVVAELILAIAMIVTLFATQHTENQVPYNNRRESSGFISDCSNDTLEITTDDGNIWLMTGMYVESGTTVRVVFDTMGTGDITDDEIVELTLVL